MDSEHSPSRPASPESVLTSSFHDADSTINDLIKALSILSQATTPESAEALTCCCGKSSCENLVSWIGVKMHLENNLHISGQIGAALLAKHEAYVRNHEKQQESPKASLVSINTATGDRTELNEDELEILHRERSQLEKRLTRAFTSSEALEASNKTLTDELNEARATISRLTAQQARSVGLEQRVATLARERDDMQQERDAETSRAKLGESRLSAMKDKTAKLQSEVRRLQDTLTQRALRRTQSSEDTLRDARIQLAALNDAEVGKTALIEQTELMNVLESLVNDNDVLKRDNGELQTMLTASNEQVDALQEEIEELKMRPVSRSGAGTPLFRQHFSLGGVPGSLGRETTLHRNGTRSISIERRPRRSIEPLTPETTSQRPLSPADSVASEPRWSTFTQPEPGSAQSGAFTDDAWNEGEDTMRPPGIQRARKPILLLMKDAEVQTESITHLSASPMPSYTSSMSPHDPRSESSSYSETPASNLAIILERVHSLITRMTQADALTLTNRLKRQHLRGADVGHLSRATVNAILAELTNLRAQFRFLLEDDSVVSTCTRKDFRNLFRLLKDVFQELGELRIILNDIVLDPTIAKRVSEAAMNLSKVEADKQDKERDGAGGSGVGAWMAPISKLFSPTGQPSADRPTVNHSPGIRPTARAPASTPRFVPKQRPALSASATTVNVEFSGTGAGRSTSSTVAGTPPNNSLLASPPISQQSSTSSGIMNIFAGAPQPPANAEPWVVVSKGPRKAQSFIRPTGLPATGTIGRSATMSVSARNRGLSRHVDAIIDIPSPTTDSNEESDIVGPLLHRTLRRRGLSDSSIHSAFANHGAEETSQPAGAGVAADTGASSSRVYGSLAWPEKMSVFSALSRTVQTLRNTAQESITEFAGSLAPSPVPHPSGASSSAATHSDQRRQQQNEGEGTSPLVSSSPRRDAPSRSRLQPAAAARAASPSGIRDLLPALSTWVAAGELMEGGHPGGALLVGSVGDPVFVPSVRRGPHHHHGQDFL